MGADPYIPLDEAEQRSGLTGAIKASIFICGLSTRW